MKSIDSADIPGSKRTPRLRRLARPITLSLIVTAIGGCAVGPEFHAPAPPADTTYLRSQPSSITAAGAAAQQINSANGTNEAWWQAFNSPRLNALVDEGLANNYDIASALEKLARARHVADAVEGERLPQVDLSASTGRTRYGAAFLGDEAKGFAPYSYYAIGPSVTYDFDLFGRIRRSKERADALAEVQADELEAVRLNVSGDIVNEVIAAAAIRDQLDALQSILVSSTAQQRILQRARTTGGVSEVDLEQKNRSVDDIDSRIAVEQQRLAAAQDALTVLVGKTPGTWTPPAIDLAELHLPQDIPLTLPSALVRRRPDIRAAEASLHAQNAQIGIATAEYVSGHRVDGNAERRRTLLRAIRIGMGCAGRHQRAGVRRRQTACAEAGGAGWLRCRTGGLSSDGGQSVR